MGPLVFGEGLADTSGGQRIDGNPSQANCACEGPLHGLNIGNSACRARTDRLTSTFSHWDMTAAGLMPAKPSLACAGGHPGQWAFCPDAPCTVESGAVTCACELRPASDDYTFTDACPEDEAALTSDCSKIWSVASRAELESGYSQLVPFYGNPPTISYCPTK